MSFNDLERGTTSSPTSRSSPRPNRPSSSGPLPLYHAPRSAYRDDDDDDDTDNAATKSPLTPNQQAEFKRLADSIGTQIFKINSNTTAIDKLVKLAGQRHKRDDTPTDWTKRSHDLIESTRAIVKATTPSLKQISTLLLDSDAATSNPAAQQYKLTLSRLQRDFEAALVAFSTVQKQSAQRSKEEVQGAKRRLNSSVGAVAEEQQEQQARDDQEQGQTQQQQLQQQQQQQQQTTTGPSSAEIEFQEALISEREAEIREIESGIHELNEIFRDLGAIVQEQGGMIDNIEYNINQVAIDSQGGERELTQANEYQRKAGKRAACLLLIVGFVVAVVLVAILS